MKEKEIAFWMLLLFGSILYVIPYYVRRIDSYNKHLYVLREFCQSNVIPPQIQVNKLTYDGLPTNCTESKLYINVPIFVGAIIDAYTSSIFHTLATANHWMIQCLYLTLIIIIAIKTIDGVVYHYFKNTSKTSKNDKVKPEIKDSLITVSEKN